MTSSKERITKIPKISEVSAQSIQGTKKNSVLFEAQDAAPKWLVKDIASQLPSGAPVEGSSSPIPFFHLLERLKTTPREGWCRFGVKKAESISDHMYRMALMTMFAPKSLAGSIDIQHCMKMALIHDMAEALVGDITPVEGVTKAEKNWRESTTMDYLTKDILGHVNGGTVGVDIRAIWQEYEDGETLESKFVHDIDKIELILQMVEYERASQCKCDLGEMTWVICKVMLPEVKEWAQAILQEREELWGGQEHVSYTPIGDPVVEAKMLSKKHQHHGKRNTEVEPIANGLTNTSGVRAKAFHTPCKNPPDSTTSSPLLTKSATTIMSIPTLGEKLLKEGGARKRNLSEFADGSGIFIDETTKEQRWMPYSLVNTWYQFDGRTEPSSPGITRFDSNEYGDISYRRRLDDMSTPRSKLDVCDSTDRLNSAFQGPEKAHHSSYEERGWSQVALQAINVVAGKAWEFCKNSTAIFRGFHAGGGTRYKLKYNEDSNLYFEAVENAGPVKKENICESSHSSLYAESPCISQSLSSNIYDDIKLDYSPQRSSKRYQLSSNNNDSLERNWVVIPTMASTPNKTCQGLATKRKFLSTNLPRFSPTQTRSSQSYAASRATGGTITYRRSNLRTIRPQVSHAGSPTLSATYRASFASPRSSGGFIPRLATPNTKMMGKHIQDASFGSPIALESKRQAQKWAVKLKKGEKKQDESIQRLDQRLKEMIRQGKEALGSKFEVSLEDYDENETI